MSVSLVCDCVTGMVLYNVMTRRNDNAWKFIVILLKMKTLIFWAACWRVIWSLKAPNVWRDKILSAAVTKPKISDFFKYDVKFQETKFMLWNHRGRCFITVSKCIFIFQLPKSSQKYRCYALLKTRFFSLRLEFQIAHFESEPLIYYYRYVDTVCMAMHI